MASAAGDQPVTKKVKKERHFRTQWLEQVEFKNWLIYTENKMKCSLCIRANQSNTFTKGTEDFQMSALNKHIQTDSHKRAQVILKQRDAWNVAAKKQENKCSDNLEAQMKTAYFLVQHYLPLNLYNNIIELQKSNDAPRLQTGTYKSHEAVTDMVKSISDDLCADLKSVVENSPFVGLMTDESIDIAVFKKLVIYIQVILQGKSHVMFATNVDVIDGKADTIVAALLGFMHEFGIPITKLLGLGSDGAAVMMGRKTGVGKQLKDRNALLLHTHCYAHRLALAISQAASSVNQISIYQTTVQTNYAHFSNSANRYNNLRMIYDLLEDDRFITLKQPHAIRWLSLDQAVTSIYKCWPALIAAHSREAANGTAQARGLLAKMETYDFIALTCLLYDILPLFSRLSKTFQSESLDFSTATAAMETVRATLTTMSADNDNNSIPSLKELNDCIETQVAAQANEIKFRETEVKKVDMQKPRFPNVKGKNYF